MSDDIRTTVRDKYGKAALAVIQGGPTGFGCCGPNRGEET